MANSNLTVDDESDKENGKNRINMLVKEEKEEDAMSLYSIQSNRSIFSLKSSNFMRRCSLPKLPSLANLMQPNEMLRSMGNTLTKTCSFKNLHRITLNDVNLKSTKYPKERVSFRIQYNNSSNNNIGNTPIALDKNKLEGMKLHRGHGFKRKALNSNLNVTVPNGSPTKILKCSPFIIKGKDEANDPKSFNQKEILSDSINTIKSLHTKIVGVGTNPNYHKRESLINALISSPFRKHNSLNNSDYVKRQSSNFKCDMQYNSKTKAKKQLKHTLKQCWVETTSTEVLKMYTKKEIKRQEAIYELYRREVETIDDLVCLRSVYFESMKQLSLIKNEEIDSTFMSLCKIIPPHQSRHTRAYLSFAPNIKGLASQIEGLRDSDNFIATIGPTLYNWVPSLGGCIEYCSNIDALRTLLETKYKEDARVQDFLLRCQQSPFSRRLDIWSFIDLPRRYLAKYPLLFDKIIESTPENHEDLSLVKLSMKEVEKILLLANKKIGQNKCVTAIKSLEFVHEYQKSPLIPECQELICTGALKTNKGTKVTAFLFDKLLILTRPSSFNAKNPNKYRVYKTPIPLDRLLLVVDEDTEVGEQVKLTQEKPCLSSPFGDVKLLLDPEISSGQGGQKPHVENSGDGRVPQEAAPAFDGRQITIDLVAADFTVTPRRSVGELRMMKIEGHKDDSGVERKFSFFDHKALTPGIGSGAGKFSFEIDLCQYPLNDHKSPNVCIMERHILHASDPHDKKLWVKAIREAVEYSKSDLPPFV